MKTEINIDEEIKDPKGVIKVDKEFIGTKQIEVVRLALRQIPFKVIITKDGLEFKKEQRE